MKNKVIRCKDCRYYDPCNLWCFKFLKYVIGDNYQCDQGKKLE